MTILKFLLNFNEKNGVQTRCLSNWFLISWARWVIFLHRQFILWHYKIVSTLRCRIGVKSLVKMVKNLKKLLQVHWVCTASGVYCILFFIFSCFTVDSIHINKYEGFKYKTDPFINSVFILKLFKNLFFWKASNEHVFISKQLSLLG